MKLGSKEEILEMVKHDIALASFINPDRIKIISKAAEEVLMRLNKANIKSKGAY